MSNDPKKQHLADYLPKPRNVLRNGESIVEFHQGQEKVGEINFTKIFESILDRLMNPHRNISMGSSRSPE